MSASPTDAADLAACRAALARHARSFHAASLLLPPQVRAGASVLYAWCRLADDAVDVQGRRGAIEHLRRRLEAVYAGRPGRQACDRALARLVHASAMPRGLFEALLEGLAWDEESRRYETLDEVLAYAARVAGAVGAMMAVLMGVRSAEALARACELGLAMQLSNIARDVREDAAMGRLYLPRAWMREAGLDPDRWLAAPAYGPALAAVQARVLAVAEKLYDDAETGIGLLPVACRPGIRTAHRLYREIGREVGRRGAAAYERRVRIGRGRKLALLGAATTRSAWEAAAGRRPQRRRSLPLAPPPPAVAWLVDLARLPAGEAVAEARIAGTVPPWWDLPARWAATLELFERLGQRERHSRAL